MSYCKLNSSHQQLVIYADYADVSHTVFCFLNFEEKMLPGLKKKEKMLFMQGMKK